MTSSETVLRSRPAAPVGSRVRFRSNHRRSIAIFTAVEGTLAGSRTLHRMIHEIQQAGASVVPVTAMTLGEVKPILRRLGIDGPAIVEAGGGIARPLKSGWSIEPCGLSAEAWLDVVRDIEERSGASLLVYSALPEPEALRLSGLKGSMLQHSMQRRFSEPFVIEQGDLESIREVAASIGFHVRQGRRLFYLSRRSDEGKAFARVRAELRCEIAVALGASALDAEFMRHAELPIILPGAGGPDPELLAEVPGARVAPAPAPDGWVAAVNEVWSMLAPARASSVGV
jgi:mannosyl-3-phosphoglycerate phosphatase